MKPLTRSEIDGALEQAGQGGWALVRNIRPSALVRRDPGDRIGARAGRQLNLGAAILAFAALADSAVEHYRGAYHNKAMFTPLAVGSLTLGASLLGVVDPRARRHAGRDAIYALAAATALAGFGFHAYNIAKRPGRISWHNLFYGAPIGAPIALALAGLMGRGAERVRHQPARRAAIFGLPAGRLLAGVTSVGLLGTAAEAALLHFRGAFHDPFMFVPVTVPPVAAGLVGAAAAKPEPRLRKLARASLWLTAAVGLAGPGFHAFGVGRNMGGWRDWRQNVLNGPPLPAPPSFTGLALAGLAALEVMQEQSHG